MGNRNAASQATNSSLANRDIAIIISIATRQEMTTMRDEVDQGHAELGSFLENARVFQRALPRESRAIPSKRWMACTGRAVVQTEHDMDVQAGLVVVVNGDNHRSRSVPRIAAHRNFATGNFGRIEPTYGRYGEFLLRMEQCPGAWNASSAGEVGSAANFPRVESGGECAKTHPNDRFGISPRDRRRRRKPGSRYGQHGSECRIKHTNNVRDFVLFPDHHEPCERRSPAGSAALSDQGLYHGRIDGILGPETKQVLGQFQKKNGLDQTATLDQPTKDKLLGNMGGGQGSSTPPAVYHGTGSTTNPQPAPAEADWVTTTSRSSNRVRNGACPRLLRGRAPGGAALLSRTSYHAP